MAALDPKIRLAQLAGAIQQAERERGQALAAIRKLKSEHPDLVLGPEIERRL